MKKIFFTTIRLLLFLVEVDNENILASNKTSFGEKNYKYFIGYLCNDHKVNPLHLMLCKTSTYVKSNDRRTKWMYFLIENDNIFNIWGKVTADIKIQIQIR